MIKTISLKKVPRYQFPCTKKRDERKQQQQQNHEQRGKKLLTRYHKISSRKHEKIIVNTMMIHRIRSYHTHTLFLSLPHNRRASTIHQLQRDVTKRTSMCVRNEKQATKGNL